MPEPLRDPICADTPPDLAASPVGDWRFVGPIIIATAENMP